MGDFPFRIAGAASAYVAAQWFWYCACPAMPSVVLTLRRVMPNSPRDLPANITIWRRRS
jgi:hypothetical protein